MAAKNKKLAKKAANKAKPPKAKATKKLVKKAKPAPKKKGKEVKKKATKKVIDKKIKKAKPAKVAPKAVAKAAVKAKVNPLKPQARKSSFTVKPIGKAIPKYVPKKEAKVPGPIKSYKEIAQERAIRKAEKIEAKKKAAIFKQVSATYNPLVPSDTYARPRPVPRPIHPPVKPITLPPVPKGKKGKPEKSRYSDTELLEFKKIIENKIAIAREEYNYYAEQLKEQGGDTDYKYNPEEGGASSDKEHLNLMASRMIKYLNNLEAALIRIENKTYGICKDTGRLIPKERLRAVPHATQIIEAKQAQA